jgi:phosphatidylserine synthase
MKEHIPNTITALNLVFGCFSMIDALQGNLTQASLWIGGAAVLDFFDGFVARMLKVGSELGKQLDSLAGYDFLCNVRSVFWRGFLYKQIPTVFNSCIQCC